MGVDYDIQFLGGFKNALFGGEGLLLAKRPSGVRLSAELFHVLPTVFMPPHVFMVKGRAKCEALARRSLAEDFGRDRQ